jgi:pyruvate dehydrogenase E1 component alpha subunit
VTDTVAVTPELQRFLDPEGRAVRPLPAFAEEPGALISLYRAMALTRTFDAKAIALQRTGRLGTYASSLGQEAVAVGIGAAMTPEDVLLPSFRELGAQILRGITLDELLLFWGGDERGSNFKGPREDFPICVPVGSHGPHAAGVALAFKLRRQLRVAVCVLGDGATSKGDVYEAMNLAGVWRLPLVFVVNNNQWAISVPRERQTAAKTLAQKAEACGFSGGQVDGNDVIAVRHCVERALATAREDGGPTLIEAVTYRLSDHTTADDASRYRDDETVGKHWKEEPLIRLRLYLTEAGLWDKDDEERLLETCSQEVEAAADRYLATAPQPPTSMFDHLYGELPADLAEQRAAVSDAGGVEDVTDD